MTKSYIRIIKFVSILRFTRVAQQGGELFIRVTATTVTGLIIAMRAIRIIRELRGITSFRAISECY